MKRLLVLVSLLYASLFSFAQTVVNVDGLRYLIENESAIVGRQDKELSGDITIPTSIEYEGKTYAVTGMVEPTNITSWSNNTVTTEGGAFQSCSITSIVIPSTITKISAGAFAYCENLQSVTLPESLTIISAASFANCGKLESIKIPASVTDFCSGSQYGTISYTFGGCVKLKTINIPSGVKILHRGCFKGAGIEEIFIPETITTLDEDCLACSTLSLVKMGVADLSKLSYSQTAFGTGNVEKADLFVPKGSMSVYQEYEPWLNFKSIQEYGEEGEVFVPEQINISYSGLKYILKNGEAIVARQPSNLSGDIVIPSVVNYKNVDYPVTKMVDPIDLVSYSNNTIVCKGGAFQGSLINSISIPSTITTIPAGAFQDCSSLKQVVLPESMKMLSAACFAGCHNLEDINIPEGITDFASNTVYGYRSYVFGGCSKIKSIVVPKGVKRLASGCFLNSGLESISIPAGCNILDKDCLDTPSLRTVNLYVRDMYNLTYSESCFGNVSEVTLKVPIGSKQVYQEYYPWMNFKNIEEFDDGLGEFVPSKITTKIDGIRYILDDAAAVVGRQDKSLSGNIVIPSKVNYEGKDYTVSSMINPTELIAWSSNTVSTENGAFQSCEISSVSIPSSIKKLPAGAFYDCGHLVNVELSSGLTQIGAACFANCSNLKEIQIPESVTEFGCGTEYGFKSYIFGNCTALKKINIPTGITCFTEGCFKGSGLEVFIIPTNVNRLEEDCFSINGLKGIKITHTNLDALTYTESIFSNVSNVSLYVPEGLSNLYSQFYPWKNFKEIIEYKDQSDEFLFNAYSIEYLIPSEIAQDRGTRTPEAGQSIFNKDYVASGIPVGLLEAPSKEGYTFNGWVDAPSIMPSHDVSIYGAYTKNKYHLNYIVDGNDYKSYEIEYGASITPEESPSKEGHTFSGWSEIPSTMPAYDVTVSGSFSVNNYKLTYMINESVYKEVMYEYGSTITPEPQPEGNYATFEWIDLPKTMPAHDVVVKASYTTGIDEITTGDYQVIQFYSTSGNKLEGPQKGVNIIKNKDGRSKKVLVK